MMKRPILILLSLLLLVSLATAQIQRGKKPTETNTKTEQTSKKPKPKKTSSDTKAKSKPKQSSNSSNNDNQSGSSSSMNQTIQAEPGAFDVTFSCNVANADMYIDGNEYGHPRGTRTLKTGSHHVQLVAEGYEDLTMTINVDSDSTSFNFKMSRVVPQEPYVAKIETFTVKGVSFDMVFVEGGTFMMGATLEQGSDAENDEKPTHQVTLSDYYISKYEVTEELWIAVMGKKRGLQRDSKKPIMYVSWEDCQNFIKRLNQLTGKSFCLPTEAQWEYAARGGKWSRGHTYSGGNNIEDVAWIVSNSGGVTHPVGQKSPNELGLYDMSGNVWEWCQDCYDNYSSVQQTNPLGSSGSYRVNRGGGWSYNAADCRVSRRSANNPTSTDRDLGLRLVL